MVDDAPTNVEVLRVRLSAQGYEVVTAVDGEEALQRARELEPDLVLLDVCELAPVAANGWGLFLIDERGK